MVRTDDAAEILGPWPIDSAVHDHMAHLPRPKLLGYRGESHQCVDLFVGKELHRLCSGIKDEVYVLAWVKTNVGSQGGQKNVVRRFRLGDGNRLALQVSNSPDSLSAEQLKTANVYPTQEHDRRVSVDLSDERRNEGHAEIELA